MLFVRKGSDTSAVEEKINVALTRTRMLYKTVGGISEYPIQVGFTESTFPIEEQTNNGGDWLSQMAKANYVRDITLEQAKITIRF